MNNWTYKDESVGGQGTASICYFLFSDREYFGSLDLGELDMRAPDYLEHLAKCEDKAKLVTAAPDLLAALEALLSLNDAHNRDIAHKAVARAKGEK